MWVSQGKTQACFGGTLPGLEESSLPQYFERSPRSPGGFYTQCEVYDKMGASVPFHFIEGDKGDYERELRKEN